MSKIDTMPPDEIARQLKAIERERDLLDRQEQQIRDELAARLLPIEDSRNRLNTEAAILRSLQSEASTDV